MHCVLAVNICIYLLPVADRSVIVIIKLMGVVDNPPNVIVTSTNPDDSEPVYCSDSNSTTNTT